MPPSSRLHPSQIRSSCERCRRHKLRCVRQPASAATCTACQRLNFECISGQQRKVGRPAKRSREVVAVRRSSSLDIVDNRPELAVQESNFFVPPQADKAPDFSWMLDESFGGFLSSGHYFDQALGSFGDMAIMPELLLPRREDYLTIRTPDVQFAALSRLNYCLNAASDVFDKASAKGVSLDALVWGMCVDEGLLKTPLGGKHGLKVLLEKAQDFLQAIRVIHRKVGIHVQPSTSEDPFTNPPPTLEFQKIDSVTAYLIISCFTQLLKIFEVVYVIVTSSFSGRSRGETAEPELFVPSTVSFADVGLHEFTAQMAVYTELSRHLLVQMMLILGIPGARWPGETTWNGLLQDERYRIMLNSEFERPIDGMWSRRPANVLSMMDAARDSIFVHSMSDYM